MTEWNESIEKCTIFRREMEFWKEKKLKNNYYRIEYMRHGAELCVPCIKTIWKCGWRHEILMTDTELKFWQRKTPSEPRLVSITSPLIPFEVNETRRSRPSRAWLSALPNRLNLSIPSPPHSCFAADVREVRRRCRWLDAVHVHAHLNSLVQWIIEIWSIYIGRVEN